MGARGPKPQLPEIDKLRGNPGKRKAKAPSPKVAPLTDADAPFVADHLSADAKACIELIRQYQAPGIYAKIDGFALAAFAAAWALHKQATQAIDAEGAVCPGSQGQSVVSPWVRIQADQARIMMSLGDRLGLDPKARAALAVPQENKKTESKFAGLLGGQH